MSYAVMLRHFRPVDVFVAIRAAVLEPPAPRSTALAFDPWFGADPDLQTAFAYEPQVVPS